jgi:hypothetical protein
MPPNPARNAPIYAERLSVPGRWWLIATAGVAVGGAEVWAGFSWRVIAVVYAAMAIPVAALLWKIGSTTVTVDADGLHAGGRTLALADMSAAAVLDRDETRRWLGPGADPAAHVVARGFVHRALLIRPVEPAGTPYWLVSTRHPEELLAVLTR